MKVKRTHYEELKLPEPSYATLLTPAELDECEEYVPYPMPYYEDENWTSAWYLRDECPLNDGGVTYASGKSVYDVTDPDWFDEGDVDEIHYGTGTRPVIVFKTSLFDAGFKPGDNFGDEYDSFTVISEFMALSDRYISVEIFDDFSNDYEDSAIKDRVDEWFNDSFVDGFLKRS